MAEPAIGELTAAFHEFGLTALGGLLRSDVEWGLRSCVQFTECVRTRRTAAAILDGV